MHRSQLVELLRTFDKKEVRDCRKWLRSPYHNQRQDVIDLFDYFFKGSNLEKETKLRKEKVFTVLFPKESFDDAKIRQSMHFLLRALESYLLFKESTIQSFSTQLILAKIYRKRQLNKTAQKALQHTDQLLGDIFTRSSSYYWNNFVYEQEAYVQHVLNNNNRYLYDNVQKLSETLDEAYCIEQLRLVCLRLSTIKSSQDVSYTSLIEKLSLPNIKYIKSEGIKIYFTLYLLLTQPSQTHFNRLKQEVESNLFLLDTDAIREFLLLLINYCVRKINSGEKQYLAELFHFYQLLIEHNAFLENGFLNPNLFKNIVTNGSILNEFDWVEQFIHDYKEYLDDDHRENYTTFCLAQLYYYKKDYDTAMRYLAAYEYDDILLNLNSRGMLTKMYYELAETTALEAHLESSKVYLRRKKGIPDNYRNVYGNFFRYTRKLLHVNPYDKEKRAKLKTEIESAPLIDKKWFLGELEKL
ncbi:MAG: hypothetical protein AAGI23_20985 [Bacteroidota bacterium]